VKSYEARNLTYRSKKLLKGTEKIDCLIRKNAKKGLFHTETILIHDDWGCQYDLKEHYEKLGYIVHTSHQQTSPNDGDDFIYISWEKENERKD